MLEFRLSGICLSDLREKSLDITMRLRISFQAVLNSVTVPFVVLPVLVRNPNKRQAQDTGRISLLYLRLTV